MSDTPSLLRNTEAQIHLVLSMCRDAARAGQRSPSNVKIAEAIGTKATAVVARLMAKMEQLGLIVVSRGNSRRVVEAADGSWRTAGEIPTDKPWRDRAPGEAPRIRKGGGRDTRPPPDPDAVVVPLSVSLAEARMAAPPPGYKPPVPAPARTPFTPPKGVSWAVDKRGCRWPMWGDHERATQMFCDAERGLECPLPYCAAHHAISRRIPMDQRTTDA